MYDIEQVAAWARSHVGEPITSLLVVNANRFDPAMQIASDEWQWPSIEKLDSFYAGDTFECTNECFPTGNGGRTYNSFWDTINSSAISTMSPNVEVIGNYCAIRFENRDADLDDDIDQKFHIVCRATGETLIMFTDIDWPCTYYVPCTITGLPVKRTIPVTVTVIAYE